MLNPKTFIIKQKLHTMALLTKSHFMKKAIFFLFVVAIACITSCDKVYNCTCTISGSSGGFMPDTDVIEKTNEHSAKNLCGTFETIEQQKLEADSATGTVNCSI
jgi:hypothetical protein